MEPDLPPSRATLLRPTVLVVLGLAILAVTAGIVLRDGSLVSPPGETNTATVMPPAAPAPAQAGSPAAPLPLKPSFDVVRINPSGDAVMAGHAAPGAKVTIADGGKPIGEVQADQNGDWVFIPSAQLPAGSRELTVTQQMPDGATTQGDRSVMLVVPGPAPQPNAPPGPPAMAVLTSPNAAPTVLTGPAPAVGSASSALALGAMEYDEGGAVRFSGTAPPGSGVRLYIDNQPVGGAVADQDGKWSLAARNALAAGEHQLRLDQLASDGKVTARLQRPFTRAQMAGMQLPPGQITIQRGQSLWVIARSSYGQGNRYLVIFQANRQQIRNPDLIYPGQVFAIPTSSAPPAIPASSSTSR